MIEFFATLPFELVRGEYPCTIPSVKEDFDHRNRVYGEVLQKFPALIDAFRTYSGHHCDPLLEGYPQAFTPHYYKYLSYAAATAAD